MRSKHEQSLNRLKGHDSMQNHPKKFLTKFNFDLAENVGVAFKTVSTKIFSEKSDGKTPVYVIRRLWKKVRNINDERTKR